MIGRRTFLGALGLSVLALPLAAEALPAAKTARIGYLAANLAASPHRLEAFRQGLRDLGYVEGGNLVIEYRDAEGKFERLPALAAELVALKVDVIVTAEGTPAALAAKQATRTLPIVFATAGDPVASGLVTSLARPGGNVTGLSILGPELFGKWLELLTQALPGVKRVAVLWQRGVLSERTDKDTLKEADVAARALGVRLQFVEARGPADFDRAFSEMTRARAGALTVMGSERHESPLARGRPFSVNVGSCGQAEEIRPLRYRAPRASAHGGQAPPCTRTRDRRTDRYRPSSKAVVYHGLRQAYSDA
jgi:ABC-type uncharacterized transport system substrate-binding protein